MPPQGARGFQTAGKGGCMEIIVPEVCACGPFWYWCNHYIWGIPRFYLHIYGCRAIIPSRYSIWVRLGIPYIVA